MKGLFTLFTLLLLCFSTSIAQEQPQKHTISNGETVMSISKKYNVTPYDLQKANPGLANGLVEGTMLTIPQTKVKTLTVRSVSDSIKESIVSSSVSHTVKSGETKYSLAKRFGLTVSQLETQNPQIISGLEVGEVLEIFPATDYRNLNASNDPVKPKSKVGKKHIVTKGQTVVGLARANGLTEDELLSANSKTISGHLIIGQVLWIPGSDDQIVINGTKTYQVKYGDTKFSLSRQFDTSIRELERQNPHISNMLVVGQTITMTTNQPDSGSLSKHQDNQNTQTTPSVAMTPEILEDKNNTSELPKEKPMPVIEKKNENIAPNRSVSKMVVTDTKQTPIEEKKFPTAVKEAKPKKEVEAFPDKASPKKEVNEKKPEGINVANAATSLEKAPTKDSMIEDAYTDADENYIKHGVLPNETLYGLAKNANMSIAEFLVLNPELKNGVHIGTFIKMPKTNSQTSDNITRSNPSAVEALALPKVAAGIADLRSSANSSPGKKILFFLPFSEEDYQNNAKNNDNFQNISDNFKREHLEFYHGAKIAMDSVKKMNLNLEVDIIEALSTNQTSKIKAVIRENTIKNYDAIILPFYKTVEDEIAAFTSDKKTPVITASNIGSKNHSNNLFSAIPSIDQQRLKVLEHMRNKKANIIVLSDHNRTESKAFLKEHAGEAHIIDLKKNGSFSDSELKSKFDRNQLNYIVIDSERNSVFLNATNTLLSELSNYKLQLAVLETSLIPDDSDVSQKRYQILKMVFPSLIPAKSTQSSKQFLSNYQNQYKLLPSANIMLGFDITFDSLLRLMQQQSFEESAKAYVTEYTQLKFEYEKNPLGGYSNEGIYILQYDANSNIRDAN